MASGTANNRNVKPLFDQLSSALKTADGSLGKFKAQGLVSRQNQDEVAAVSADIIKVCLISRLPPLQQALNFYAIEHQRHSHVVPLRHLVDQRHRTPPVQPDY